MAILKRLPLMLVFIALPVFATELPYRVIAYHDVRDDVAGDYDPDQYAVSTGNLVDQFTWLRDNGYRPVSIGEIIAARRGETSLPPKAVLLTFDDGLTSVYTRIYPLLKLFDYPAVVSVVTSWIESDAIVTYADKKLRRDDFLTWDQLREMQGSGLIEIASHSHALHEGVRGNPQGNLQPAAITRLYDGATYESEAAYRERVRQDLATSVRLITDRTGRAPRVITWPYGAVNDIAESLAAEQGMEVSLTLNTKSVSTPERLSIGRYLTIANPGLTEFSFEMSGNVPRPIVRVAQIDLDYVFDPDPLQQSRNLDAMLDRIKALEISHVFLQAFSDDDGNGGASAVYFPNRHLPVRANLFSHVAWQLKTRANVSVFAWLPMLSFEGESFDPDWRVFAHRDGVAAPDPSMGPRLSPFNALARERIGDVYEDLATYAQFDGVLFHDDGRLSGDEDFSDAAIAYLEAELGTEVTPDAIENDAELRRRFADIKAQALLDFSRELKERVRRLIPKIKSARNIFADALLDEAGKYEHAQDFDAYLDHYDYVALKAIPASKASADQEGFFEELAAAVGRREGGLDRTIFELRTLDAERSVPVRSDRLRATMRWLQSLGVRNLGYYPDDFISGHPDFDDLRLGMSLADDFTGIHR